MPHNSLESLLQGVSHELSGDPSTEITSLSYDSRKVDGQGLCSRHSSGRDSTGTASSTRRSGEALLQYLCQNLYRCLRA